MNTEKLLLALIIAIIFLIEDIKLFNALSLSNQMNESVNTLMQSANSFINDENSTSIDNVNHHATKLEALKDFTETQLTPLIEADYQKQQENARSQPFPKFLDKK